MKNTKREETGPRFYSPQKRPERIELFLPAWYRIDIFVFITDELKLSETEAVLFTATAFCGIYGRNQYPFDFQTVMQ